jgi:hypothetical protein
VTLNFDAKISKNDADAGVGTRNDGRRKFQKPLPDGLPFFDTTSPGIEIIRSYLLIPAMLKPLVFCLPITSRQCA